jgi:hypothetical protein
MGRYPEESEPEDLPGSELTTLSGERQRVEIPQGILHSLHFPIKF